MLLRCGMYVVKLLWERHLIVEEYTPDRAVEATIFLYDLFFN